MGKYLKRAAKAIRESKHIEFKKEFDVDSRKDWCEILKDIVSLANTGGGVVLFGVDNKGKPIGNDLSQLMKLDPARIADQLHRYTDSDFVGFEFIELSKATRKIVALEIAPAFPPVIFTKPGTYAIDPHNQRTAFAQGTMYFRHGAKSEPARSVDLERVLERRLNEVRKSWLGDVRKVVRAPAGSRIAVLPATIKHADSGKAMPIQIVDDPGAAAYRVVDFDLSHPYRGKELIAKVRERLPQGINFNTFDVVVLRKLYKIDERDEYAHKSKFGTRQYSQAFVDWLVRQVAKDKRFFDKARVKYRNRNSEQAGR